MILALEELALKGQKMMSAFQVYPVGALNEDLTSSWPRQGRASFGCAKYSKEVKI